MPTSLPSFFKAAWTQLFDQTTYPRVEITADFLEDLRKWLYIIYFPQSGSGREDGNAWYVYDYANWVLDLNYAGGAIKLGMSINWYGEFYILSAPQTIPPTEWTFLQLLANPPTSEGSDDGFGGEISHDDAIKNANWEKAVSFNWYRLWMPENNRYYVRHWSAYDLVTESYKWLPKYVPRNILIQSGENPSRDDIETQKVEFKAEYINRLNNGLWVRDKDDYTSEWTVDGNEPRDLGIEEIFQTHWNPLMGDGNTLGAYQDCIRMIVEHIAYLTKTNGTEDPGADGTYEQEYNRYPLLGDAKWVTAYNYSTEDIVWSEDDDGDERETGTKKYFCYVGHLSSALNKPPNTAGIGGGINWEDYWLESAYQPRNSDGTPIFTYFFDDYFNCNSSGFEKILYEMGSTHYDWYWCSAADDNFPAYPNWLSVLLDVPTAGWPVPTGCWRRTWRHGFGRPKKADGTYLEDWKIIPGGMIPLSNGEDHQLMVTQAVYDAIDGNRQWRYRVIKTDEEIQEWYYDMLDPDAVGYDEDIADDIIACRKRHDSIRYDYDNPSNQEDEYWELWRNQMKDMATVLSYLEFLDGETRYTVGNFEHIKWNLDGPTSYDNIADALLEAKTEVNARFNVVPHGHAWIDELGDEYIEVGYGIGAKTVVSPTYPVDLSLWYEYFGGVVPSDEEPRKASLCTTITRIGPAGNGVLTPASSAYAEDDSLFFMRIRYKGQEYDSVATSHTAENFSACEVGFESGSDITVTADPVDTGLGEANIVRNWYVNLAKPDEDNYQFHYTANIISDWPDEDTPCFANWVPGGSSETKKHDRKILVNPNSTGFHNWLVIRIDWSKYKNLGVFDDPPYAFGGSETYPTIIQNPADGDSE